MADAATVAAGKAQFDRFCSICHGQDAVGGGVVPDLRTSPFIAVDAWYSIVLDGALEGRRHGAVRAGARPCAGLRDPRLYCPSRKRRRCTRRRQPARQPNVSHGAVIVAQGTAAGSPACAQCHGSDCSGAFPRLAGQPAAYLSRQLQDFRSGARANDIMSPIASALSPDDAADVSAYFASLDTPFPPLAAADPDLVKKGKELAEAGDPASESLPAMHAMA